MKFNIDAKLVTARFREILKPDRFSVRTSNSATMSSMYFRVARSRCRLMICSYLIHGMGAWLGMSAALEKTPSLPPGHVWSSVETVEIRGCSMRFRTTRYPTVNIPGAPTSSCFGGGRIKNEDVYFYLEMSGLGSKPVKVEEFRDLVAVFVDSIYEWNECDETTREYSDRELLNLRVGELQISKQALEVLESLNIRTVREMCEMSNRDFCKFDNIDSVSLEVILRTIALLGLDK